MLGLARLHRLRRSALVLVTTAALLGASALHPAAVAAAPGNVSGSVYEDINGNGAQGPGESGLGGRTVWADVDDDGTVDSGEPSATTSGIGTFSISGVTDGVATSIRAIEPTGWTTTSAPVSVTVPDGGTVAGLAIAAFRPGSISGTVYEDDNGDGLRSVGDEGLPGLTVFRDNNGDSALSVGEPTVATSSSGIWSFTTLDAGSYNIRVVVPGGILRTTTDPAPVVIQSGSNPVVDFGLFSYGRVSGTVFDDANGDGVKVAGEPGRSGVTVLLDENANGAADVGEATTAADGAGAYSFASLEGGVYGVLVTLPSLYAAVSPNPAMVTVISGTNVTTIDMAISNTAVLRGSVFADANSNGNRDGGDVGDVGRTIYLDADNDGGFDVGEPNTTTDALGVWRLSGVAAGTHRPRVVRPTGTTQTTTDPLPVTVVAGSNVAGIDFGLFMQGSISGTVFVDSDGDGVKEIGEPGSSGKIVYLDTNSNGSLTGGEPSTTTDSAGGYTFTALANGTYRPRMVLPSGSQITTVLPSPVDVSSGASAAGVDFGLFVLGTISGTIFNDVNADGSRTGSEAGLGLRTAFLDTDNDGVADPGEPSSTTNSTGGWTIANLGAGTYRPRVTVPGGNAVTTPIPVALVMTSGLSATGRDFGLFTLGTLSGTVYNDTNGNGFKNTGETSQTGRTIWLDIDSDGLADAGEPTATSGVTGVYTFTGLTAGPYRARIVVPPGLTKTSTNPADVTIVSGSSFTGNDFGLFSPAAITGTVWDDTNGNAVFNAGEPGVAGITVWIDLDADGIADTGEPTNTTNSSGVWTIGGLGPGSYRAKVTTPAGRSRTNADPAPVSPPSGGSTTGVHFGLFTNATLSGTVFDDANGNGLRDSGEGGLGSRTVYLDNDADTNFDVGEPQLTTASDGTYSFTGLALGTHRPRIVVPVGWQQTGTNPIGVTPTSGQALTGANFALFARAGISGSVWDDLDGDAVRDAGEPGLAGRTLFLDANNNGLLSAGEVNTITDGSGNYTFTGLSSGTYRPRVVVPGTGLQTSVSPAPVVAISGSSSTGNDFALFTRASVSGNVYNDMSGDAVKDPADGAIASRQVFIDADNDGVLDTGEVVALTNIAGAWTITNLGPGSRAFRLVMPAGVVRTTTLPPAVPMTSGAAIVNVDFGLFTLGSIGGTVYNDLNGNGAKNPGEIGIVGRTLWIDADENGAFDAGELTATTATSGAYAFTGLGPGAYRVRVVPLSNTTLMSVLPADVTVASGTLATARDFGYFTMAVISGTVFTDANSSATRTAGENGRPSVSVYLDTDGDSTLDAGETVVTTDETGVFTFSGLTVGSYRVRAVLPPYVLQTTPAVPLVNTTSGGTASGSLIGLFAQGSIVGTVYSDDDGSQLHDGTEAVLAGRIVFLDTNSNGQINTGELTATTDADGAYEFRGLPIGSHRPRVVLAAGIALSHALPLPITVVSGTAATDIDFGVFTSGIISGTVFVDSDGNGVRDGGEAASVGRTVFLDQDDDGVKDTTEPSSISNSSGAYSFGGLAAGSHRVRIVVPAGLTRTSVLPAPITVVSATVASADFGLRTTVVTTTTPPTTTTAPATTTTTTAPTTTTSTTVVRPPPAAGERGPMKNGGGYWMTSAAGGVFSYGDARFHGSAAPFRPTSPIIGLAPTPTGNGYYQGASDGGIFAFGDATFHGSMGGKPLNQPMVSIAAVPTGGGYWLVAGDGGVFSFGSARFFGSTGSIRLNAPIVQLVPTPTANGYWLVASDGGIFAYGDARFFGSTGSIRLNAPIVSMEAGPDGNGYLMVASDGGVFAFGSAPFLGSMGGRPLNQPIVKVRARSDGTGYWFFARDGGVFSFGTARFFGGSPALDSPIVG